MTGLMVWTWYAAFEYAFSSVRAAARIPDTMFLPWHWQLTAEFIVAYALIGLALGAIIGTLSRSERTVRGAALLTLIGAFLLNAGFIETSEFEWADLETWAAAILVTILVWRSLRSKSWHSKSWTIPPWLVVSILVAGPFHSWPRIAFFPVAFAASFLISKLKAPRFSMSSLRWQMVASVAMLAAAMAVSLAFDHKLSTEGLANAKPVASPAPNIVLITMDTVRADHLSTYGYFRNTTPNLAAFATGATLYRHTVAVSNMTLATHASMFTGLYAGVHGADYDPPAYPSGRPLAPGIPTVTEMLAQRGYVTLGVVANYGFLSSFFGLDRGFQVYDVREPVPVLHTSSHLFLRIGVRRLIGLFASNVAFDRNTRRAEEIDRTAIQLLRQTRTRQAPVFLFLNYMDAHWPYLPPAPYDEMFPGKLRNFTDVYYKRLEQDLIFLRRDITPREKEHLISQYDGGIAYLDFELGRLFASLKELGLYDNSLIVVTSDHGENFGDRHLLQHGVAIYHDEVNIPLIVKYPGQNAGRTVDDLVSQIDLAPTILEAAGVPRPPAFAGQSLTQPVDSERCLYSEAFPPDAPYNLAERFIRTERAIYHHHQKFIESTKGDRELYDLDTDPEERRNLYLHAGGFDQASALKNILDKWVARQPKFVSEPGSAPQRVSEQLKSLGYAQ
jgi:arylsulfatase A-like enzyme